MPAITLEQYERLQPGSNITHDGVTMRFYTPSTFTRWRVQTIYTKEPCTLEWIASFQPGEVLVDCGANVGMYTIWSAATRGVQVYAFEPESQNYAVLNRNILVNKLGDRVTAFCMGLSDVTGLSRLHMQDLRIGGSCHSVGDEVNFKLEDLKASFHQGCMAMRLDDLVFDGSIPMPAHIKIDVDGLEHKVIAGARKTLADSRVKSLLIETNQNLPEHLGLVKELRDVGFTTDQDQIDKAERKDGAFKGVAEIIFRR